jgi:hypothetical protein
MTCSLDVQKLAMQGDVVALASVLGSRKPTLADAIREIVTAYVTATEYADAVNAEMLRVVVNAPAWYKNRNCCIGSVMRELGYARHGDEWRYGVKPIGRKAKRHGSRFTVASLRRMKRRDLERLLALVQGELQGRSS